MHMTEREQVIHVEGIFDTTKSFETLSRFPIHIKDGIGNSHIQKAVTDLQEHHNYQDARDQHAFAQLLSCFEPLPEAMIEHPTHPEATSLWDQIGDGYFAFSKLSPEEQQTLHAVTELSIWSLANAPQDRKIQGTIRDVSNTVRDTALSLLDTTESWLPTTEKQKKDVRSLIPADKRKKVITALIGATTLLAACTNGPVKASDISHPAVTPGAPVETFPTSVARTPTKEPTITPTKTKEPTITPTKTVELKAGIPETFEECNKIDMPTKKDGTFDPDAMANILDRLTKVEKQWLADQGITADMMGDMITATGRTEAEQYLPYNQLWVYNKPVHIVSCSQFMFQDHPYMLLGFAFKAGDGNKNITILHGVYDDVGMRNITVADAAQLDIFEKNYTKEQAFDHIHESNSSAYHIFVGSKYTGTVHPEWFHLWPLTLAILPAYDHLNEPMFSSNDPWSPLFYYMGFEIPVDPKPLESDWSYTVEHTLYPLGVVYF